MKNKIILILMAALIIFSLVGCGGKSEAEKLAEIETQISEDIIGNWKNGNAYMSFFDGGRMFMINGNTGNGSELNYQVDGDTVITYLQGKSIKMFSVKVADGKLTYTSEDGNNLSWTSVSNQEISAILSE